MSVKSRLNYLFQGVSDAFTDPPTSPQWLEDLKVVIGPLYTVLMSVLGQKASDAHAASLQSAIASVHRRLDQIEDKVDPPSAQVVAEVERLYASVPMWKGITAILDQRPGEAVQDAFRRGALKWRPEEPAGRWEVSVGACPPCAGKWEPIGVDPQGVTVWRRWTTDPAAL